MDLNSLFRPSNDGLSESLEELSQIFNEPLLNELTDKLLSDANIDEFGEFVLDDFRQEPQTYFHDLIPTDPPVMISSTKSGTVSSEKLNRSNHATLEALLKSQTLSSCSPAAPELCAKPGNLINRRENETEIYPSRHLQKEPQVTSLPDLLSEQNRTRNQTQTDKCVPRSKLVGNLLDKPLVTDAPKLPATNSGVYYPNLIFLDSAIEKRSCCSETLSNGNHDAGMYNNDNGASTDVSRSSSKPVKRTPHNAIEKRYRASINGRIDELRKILIPYPNADSKVNKSAVLRQAIDRIKELEAKNDQLQAELQALRSLRKVAPILGSFSYNAESGVCSFESSPSSDSFTSFDMGNLTPLSSGTTCGILSNHRDNESGDSALSSSGSQSSPDSFGAAPWSIDIESSMQIFKAPDFITTATPACGMQVSQNNHNEEGLMKFTKYATSLLTSTSTCGFDLKDPSDCSSNTQQPYVNGDPMIDGPTTQNLPTFAEFLAADKITAADLNSLPKETNFHSVRKSSNSPLIGGKRTADYLTSRPAKIRRELFVSSGANVADESAYQLISTLPSNSSVELQPDRQPAIRKLLYTSDVHMNSDISPEDIRAPRPTFTPNFGGVAARTTLCVVALCLIAFDPFILTGNQRTPNSQDLQFSPARRLLSVFTTISPEENAEDSYNCWLTWVACVVQWSVAAFLFLRACQMISPSQTELDARFVAASESADLHWTKANDALAKSSWSLAEQHLWLCLADLDAPLINRQYKFDHLANYMFCLRDWVAIFLEAAWIFVTRTPRWIWTMNVRPWFRRRINAPVRSEPVTLSERPSSLAEIRLRLLELYLFAMNSGQLDSSCLVTVHPLAWFRLILSCVCDFTDGAIQAVRQKGRKSVKKRGYALDSYLRPSLVVRQGVTLLLIMSRRGCSRVSHIFAHRILTVANRLPDDTIWGRWISNPVIRSIFIQRPYDCVCLPQSSGEKISSRLYQVIQAKLEKYLTAHCLRVLLHKTCPDFYELGPSFQALLEICSAKHTEYLAAESYGFVFPRHSLSSSDEAVDSYSKALLKDRWWAQFTAVLWFSLVRAEGIAAELVQVDTSVGGALPTSLEEPPAVVLSCPETGELARALWVAYRAACCGLPPAESYSLACRASTLIEEALKNICDRCTSISEYDSLVFIDDMSIPFEVLVWTLIAADIVGSIIAFPFMAPKLLHKEFILPLNMPSDVLKACTSAAQTFRRVSYMLGSERPEWIRLKLLCIETSSAIISGSNPVRARVRLMQRFREVLKHLPWTMVQTYKRRWLTVMTYLYGVGFPCHNKISSADHSRRKLPPAAYSPKSSQEVDHIPRTANLELLGDELFTQSLAS
ncbi:unnamed protein product [Calicophoron daubneyi]|uniref:BHLH domain-containing protein n=1 Tax=Calicophoron daubneyi TaxID=300641 RepID=A0AAV2T0M5_CALDB